jgi:hypothetical protein
VIGVCGDGPLHFPRIRIVSTIIGGDHTTSPSHVRVEYDPLTAARRGGFVERSVEIFACVQFLVIGLSHLFQPRAWIEFFIMLRDKGHAGAFANGFLSLVFGSIIVGFHNVWSGLPLVLTLIGWAQIVKALVSFVAPQFAMRGLQRPSFDRAWEFQAGGVIFLLLSGLMAYVVVRS